MTIQWCSIPLPLFQAGFHGVPAFLSGQQNIGKDAAFSFGTQLQFTAYRLQNGNMTLVWRSIPGAHYQVEFATNLTPLSWATVSGDLVATTSTTTFTHVPRSTRGFYRIRQTQ